MTGSAPSRTLAPAPPTSHPQLIRIDLAHPTEVETIENPLAQPQGHGRNTLAPAPPSLHKVHVDPSGRHVLVSTSSGENFYLYVGVLPANLPSSNAPPTRKVRPLPRLKGAIVDSVAWSPSSFASPAASTSFSTREILLGTTTGQILETTLVDPALASDTGGFSLPVPGRANSPERYVKQLLTLPERQSIVGLRYEIWNTRRLAVVAATTTKVYQYVGDGATLGNQKHSRDEDAGLLETVLHLYASGDVRPSELSALSSHPYESHSSQLYPRCSEMLELPSDSTRSELHFCAPARTDGKEGLARPKSMAWMTGQLHALGSALLIAKPLILPFCLRRSGRLPREPRLPSRFHGPDPRRCCHRFGLADPVPARLEWNLFGRGAAGQHGFDGASLCVALLGQDLRGRYLDRQSCLPGDAGLCESRLSTPTRIERETN